MSSETLVFGKIENENRHDSAARIVKMAMSAACPWRFGASSRAWMTSPM